MDSDVDLKQAGGIVAHKAKRTLPEHGLCGLSVLELITVIPRVANGKLTCRLPKKLALLQTFFVVDSSKKQ